MTTAQLSLETTLEND